MALGQSFLHYFPHHVSRTQQFSVTPSIYTPKIVPKNSGHCSSTISCCARKPIPTTEEEVLQAVVESNEKILPCVRTYENDLSRLTLVGAVDFQQSVAAAAADGGEAATEHLDSGMTAMVVETVFPGTSDEHSTVSTRLFLPAREVMKKASKLKSSLAQDIQLSTTSKNILAMTFRQVVLQQLWNFELVVFRPGSERSMEDLEKPREVPISFTLSSADERVISVLAEAVCVCALQNTERTFLNVGTSTSLFGWFRKPIMVASKDSSVVIHEFYDNEVADNAKSLLQKFSSRKESWKYKDPRSINSWWMPSALAKLEKIGGADFSAWASEFIPAYRLQIDAHQFESSKFEGWRKSVENRWEVLLTHSQMVGLANILDMFYEDVYSLPNKQLSCGSIVHSANLLGKKRNSSSWGLLSKTFAGGIFLVAISAIGQLFLSRLHVSGKHLVRQEPITPFYGVDYVKNQTSEAAKLEEFCISILKIMKDAFGWPGDIHTEKNVGAWIGEVPDYLRVVKSDFVSDDAPSFMSEQDNIDDRVKASAQDIASYQVVLSTDGKIVGFQPTSRVAVNYWAANPLAKQLYGGKKLSPGLIESGLKVSRPSEVILIELLMSVKNDAFFALARPASCE